MIADTATGILGDIALGKRTPSEVIETTLMRIASWQPVTNAFVDVYAEEAVKAARNAESTMGRGGPPGPLNGVPVAVKDLFNVENHLTTGCSRAYEKNFAVRDSAMVARVRAAGGIIVGKTNQHELAMGGTNLLSTAGPTHNPWNPARITGGSSGGSAAAVASGVVPLALGTDTGGSIRNPSVMCGIWGLKPTYGRLLLDGVMPLAPSMDVAGPMAGTIADLELLWRILSRSEDAGVFPARVGLLTGFFATLVHPAIRKALGDVVATLRVLGATVVEVEGDGLDDIAAAWPDLVCMELVKAHPNLENERDKLFPRTAEFVTRGLALGEQEKGWLMRRAADAREWFDRRFEDVDMLLAPSAPYPAPPPGDEDVDVGDGRRLDIHTGGTSRFTRPVNLAELPAIAVPAGFSEDGLPVGVQLIGRAGEDDALIRTGRELAAADSRYRPEVPSFPAGANGSETAPEASA